MLMVILHAISEEALKVWHEFRHLKRNAAANQALKAAGGHE
jgi:hypothetical protein